MIQIYDSIYKSLRGKTLVLTTMVHSSPCTSGFLVKQSEGETLQPVFVNENSSSAWSAVLCVEKKKKKELKDKINDNSDSSYNPYSISIIHNILDVTCMHQYTMKRH